MRTVIAIAALVTATLLGGCERQASQFVPPANSPEQVLGIARAHMTAKGTVIDNYKLSGLSFDYVDREWHVFFDGKSLVVGDHFTVVVPDANTQNIKVVAGL